MSRSDVPRADSRPGVRAPKPHDEERRAPAPSAFTTTLAYGVASSRPSSGPSSGKDHPPPPPSPRPHLTPEPATQRDSSSLLDLEAKPPEELHLRFEPVMGIAPDPRARHAPEVRQRLVTPPQPRQRRDTQDPRQRRDTPDLRQRIDTPEPRTRVGVPDPRMRHTTPAGEYPTDRAESPQRRPPVPPHQPAAPRLNLKRLDLEDSSPTTKFATQPSASGMKVRYWIYGLAVGLGAAALVAAGYSAAFMQMTLRDDRPTLSQTTSTAQTSVAAATDRPMPEPAAPETPSRAVLPASATRSAEPSEGAQEPLAAPGSRGKQAARTHNARSRSAPTAAFEPAEANEQTSDTDEPEPLAAAPRIEPNPSPAENPAPSAPAPSAPAPRLIITPLPDVPEPPAPSASDSRIDAKIDAVVSNALEPAPSPSESAATKPASEPAASAAAVAPGENLPAQLSREDIQQNLLGMRDKLATCAGTQHGTSYANVTINGSGRVSYSTIDGAFAGTPAGSCMARTLRGATFPRFSGPQMTVRYPYVF